jgi:hypothetical protein
MLADRVGLLGGLQIVSFACLMSAAAFGFAIRHYHADLTRAQRTSGVPAATTAGSSSS